MITNTAPHVSPSKNGKENVPVLHKATEANRQKDIVFSIRGILRWLTMLLTLLIITSGIDPNAFGIPLNLRPWVFVTSIFWLMAYCSGMFNP